MKGTRCALIFCYFCYFAGAAFAQSPTSSLPQPSNSSQVAVQNSTVASGSPAGTEVAPGLRLTPEALVWVLADDGPKKLLPISHHDAKIRDDVAANVARSALWSKQRKPALIAGNKADVRIRDRLPVVFVALTEAEERELAKSAPEDRPRYAIVKLTPEENTRVVGYFEFSRFKGKATFVQSAMKTKQERRPEGMWVQITPSQPLVPGEYALVQVPPNPGTFSAWIFDFGVD